MRPIDEQTILITGSTDGLGLETARALAERGAAVLLHGRSRERGEATLSELREQSGNEKIRFYLADLSSLAEVRRLAGALDRDTNRLDVLLNNAGVGGLVDREVSLDGYELHFAVNYLAPFLLTGLLLPLLGRSTPARVVNVSSIAQTPIDFSDVMLEEGYELNRAYEQSKLAQVMFTFELSERLRAEGKEGISTTALHPASLMDTKMVRGWFPEPLTTISEGVDALVRLAISPNLDGVTGCYFEGQNEKRADEQAYDGEARRRLWELSDELVAKESVR